MKMHTSSVELSSSSPQCLPRRTQWASCAQRLSQNKCNHRTQAVRNPADLPNNNAEEYRFPRIMLFKLALPLNLKLIELDLKC